MRFDLEIQPRLFQLIYIKEENNIPTSAIPLYYCKVNERNKIPADLVIIDQETTFSEYSTLPIITINEAESFDINILSQDTGRGSDKFLLTHISKFSRQYGITTPLFYKAVFSNTLFKGNSVKIYEINNIEISSDNYYVESFDSTNETVVYINPIVDNILSIEYTTSSSELKREMLKLTPAFKEIDASFIITGGTLGTYEYYIVNGTVTTGYTGSVYLAFKRDISFVLPPVAALDEPWYLRFTNEIFYKQVGGSTVQYYLPEYEIKRLNNQSYKRTYTFQQSKILGSSYIKLQEIPIIEDGIDIFIKDTYTGNIVANFTTTTSKVNTLSSYNIKYSKVLDYNNDGIFNVQMNIEDYHIAYATYTINDIYYEFRTLDINSSDINNSYLVSLYIVPASEAISVGLYFAYIGLYDSSNPEDKLYTNGAGFVSRESYMSFIEQYNCLHVGYIALNMDTISESIDYIDCRDSNVMLTNKLELSKTNANIFKRDIIEENVKLHYSDTVLCYIDPEVFSTKEIMKTSKIPYVLMKQDYLDFIEDVVSKNIDASTNVVMTTKVDEDIILQKQQVLPPVTPPTTPTSTSTIYIGVYNSLTVTYADIDLVGSVPVIRSYPIKGGFDITVEINSETGGYIWVIVPKSLTQLDPFIYVGGFATTSFEQTEGKLKDKYGNVEIDYIFYRSEYLQHGGPEQDFLIRVIANVQNTRY